MRLVRGGVKVVARYHSRMRRRARGEGSSRWYAGNRGREGLRRGSLDGSVGVEIEGSPLREGKVVCEMIWVGEARAGVGGHFGVARRRSDDL
jgi:hypothetical protein